MDNGVCWVDTLSALLVPLIACMTLLIAYRQWRTAQNKLKLDLFDKRLAIYETVAGFISSILCSGKVTDEDIRIFLTGTREAKWLLTEEIANYLNKEIYNKAIDIQTCEAELKELPVCDRRTELVGRQSEAKKWIVAQFPVVDQHFKKYMKINH